MHKGDCVRLRNRKRVMENIQNVFMRLFQCETQSTCTNESTSPTQKSCTDVFYWRVRGFNEQGAWQVCHRKYARFQGTMEKLIYIWPECWTQRRTSKDECCVVCGEHCSAIQKQDARMAMQGDFECLLNNDGFKHTDIQIQRRSEWHERTPGFKDSNVNNLVTSDQTNIRRKMEEGRRSWILNEIDATRREFVGPRQVGFC